MKQKIISIMFIIFIFGIFIISFVFKDEELSTFERRKLAQSPKLDKNFTQNLDKYIIDQFPFRNDFINLNSNINRNIFKIKDYNNVNIIKDTIYEINYPLDQKQCDNFCKKVNYIIKNDLSNSNVYYSIIPNKEYFLDDDKYLKLDYDLLLKSTNIEAEYIDIMQVLNIEDYYKTDIHWKQENLEKVAKLLIKKMKNTFFDVDYTQNKYNNFYGASYSKSGLNIKPDELIFLSSKYTEAAKVNHLEYGKKDVYDIQKVDGMDSYDIYLSGASSFIEITNTLAMNDKELIIFRDSFGSSIAPLLIPYCRKITLIDLRYINYDIVRNIVDFNNKDVLFIYSAEIINNSSLLKVFL